MIETRAFNRRLITFATQAALLVVFGMCMTTNLFGDAAQDCQQDKDLKLRVQGCTELLNRSLRPDAQALVYTYRGSAYAGLGQYDAAIDDLSRSLSGKADAYAYTLRGGAYEMKKRYDLAFKDFSAAIQLKPEIAELYLYRGNCQLVKGDTAAAVEDFSLVINKKPESPDAYYWRARAQVLLNHNDAAIADLTKVIGLDAKWKAVALFYRALANEARGRYDLAEADFSSAIKLESSLAMERRWVEYLKSIQADKDYPNWSDRPYDLYLRNGEL